VFNVSSQILNVFDDLTLPPIEQIRVLGVVDEPSEAAIIQDGLAINITASLRYHAETKVLTVSNTVGINVEGARDVARKHSA